MAGLFGNQSKSYLSDLVQFALNGFKSIGYQQLTLSSSVQNLTVPVGTRYVQIIVESSITSTCGRYLCFGGSNTVVSSGIGMPIRDGMFIDIVDFTNISNFQVIEETTGTHKINVQYFK